ncbi:MAG: extracellular solute-binding protein, partial [Pseudomonadota bacterium]
MTKSYTRRGAIKTGAAVSAFAGVTFLTSKKTLAQREQKLIYWHLPNFTPLADDIMRDQFEEFRKMAGLSESEAAFVPTAGQDFIPRLSAALETDTPPDVVRLYESYVQLYRSQGHMMDVTDIVTKMQGEQGGVFESSLIAAGFDGKFWGVPYAINPWPMHVRMDVLEENSVEYPKTWDEFVETCLKIQKPPFYGFGMDLGLTADATDNIMQVCWCFGGKTFNADGTPAFDNQGNIDGFTFINEMYNTHKIIPRGVVGNGDTAWNNKAYQSGQVAFINNPTSVYAYLSGEDPELMEKTGLFGVPAGPAGAVNQIDTWSLGLFNQTPYPELSRGFAEYVMAPERYNQIITNTNGRFVPVYPDLFNDEWWTSRPQFNQFIEIAKSGVPVSYEAPPSPASGEMLAIHVIPEALQTVLVDGVEPVVDRGDPGMSVGHGLGRVHTIDQHRLQRFRNHVDRQHFTGRRRRRCFVAHRHATLGD